VGIEKRKKPRKTRTKQYGACLASAALTCARDEPYEDIVLPERQKWVKKGLELSINLG
jgi:hypothetical protein